MSVNAMVWSGEGINTDIEMVQGFERAGARAQRVHINDAISGKERLEEYQVLVVPGGFAFGDDLGAGKAFANKVVHALSNQHRFFEDVQQFIAEGKLVLGVCNGFQIITKMGLLPGFDGNYNEQPFSVVQNASARFEDRWVRLKGNEKSPCVWTKGIDKVDLPVRHGEGRIVVRDERVLKRMQEKEHVVLWYANSAYAPTMQYPDNPNGSRGSIAGVCDESGKVFGLMPHPEAHQYFINHPQWTRRASALRRGGEKVPEEGGGMAFFKNALEYATEKLL